MSNQMYTVKSGDTIGRIAHNFGVSPQSIAKSSHINNNAKLAMCNKNKTKLKTCIADAKGVIHDSKVYFQYRVNN